MDTVAILGVQVHCRMAGPVTYVPLRPLADAFGLSWKPQLTKLKRLHGNDLKSLPFPSRDGSHRRMVSMPVESVRSWLTGLNARKISATASARLASALQEEKERKLLRARQLLLEQRVLGFGEDFRHLPLCGAELKLLADADGNDFIVTFGYRWIKDVARDQLALRHFLEMHGLLDQSVEFGSRIADADDGAEPG